MRYGVDMLMHRVATSEQYRDGLTTIRVRWAFRDFIEAHVMLDIADAERAAAEEGGRGR